VKPVVDAGKSELIADEYRVSESVSTFPTPGHSPGHLSILIRSEGEEAVLLGDVAHHPCQFEHLDWSSSFDSDPKGSAATREQVFRRFAGTPARIFGGHFHPGYAVAVGNSFRLLQTPAK
jgi:glyoxylase-like metal-dependent hydrolase (beta-lactamase superfamily II)